MKNLIIDSKQILRFLGYGEREPHEKIIKMVQEEIDKSDTYWESQFYSKIIKVISVDGKKIILENQIILEDDFLFNQLKECTAVGVNIVTLGNKIGKVIKEYMVKREVMRSLICDKIAVVALDCIVDEKRRELLEELRKDNLNITCEVFPGESAWDVENLKTLFSVFNKEEINVSLNEYCMMEPIKSTAFIWGIGRGKAMDCGHRCSRCSNPCSFREGSW
ncbi:hypothetical protein [Oceanirhabdus seepicola]|uniref:Uncharacterized protein n=1 Tax=Oceanirhabdus seepicola TaxID=2828781 RepID=A0A9J6P584_9CLOT|nr:hypothetical protein [Oceanirhabdus seepicola]MCM1991249.1 hypothetical protein [Oceanirhabdus seepicola]